MEEISAFEERALVETHVTKSANILMIGSEYEILNTEFPLIGVEEIFLQGES